MKLRTYQEDAIKTVEEKFAKGINKQVIALATGTGKTIIFSALSSSRIEKTGKKVLIIAHREELLTQAKQKLERVNGLLKVGIEQAENHTNPAHYDVIVASVPTLGRINSSRIEKLNPKDFCLIVVDEAHHASADSYKAILRYFGVLKDDSENNWNKDCLLLGVTATPSRMDNKGINVIFDEITYSYPILTGIQDGFLSRIRAYRVNTYTDISQIQQTAGDFNLGELGRVVNNEDRNGLIVKAYKTITPNQQALCFAVDVAHTQELCKRFLEEGIKANYVVGTTPKEERAALLQDFRDHKIQVMVNAMVLTEGYDNESIEVILMGRPTQSGILFQQMVGRGTRVYPGKACLTVIDFVDNTHKQRLQTAASLLGYRGALDFKGKDILDVKEEVDKLLEVAPNANLAKIDIDKIKYAIEEVDLLSGLKLPEEIQLYTSFDWHRWGEDAYRIGLGNGHYISIQQTVTEDFKVTDDTYDKSTRREISHPVGAAKTLETAIKGADYYINKHFPDQVILITQNAGWRKQAPSPAQERLLKKFLVNQLVIQQLTKGDASRLISRLINQEKQRRVL